MPEECDKLDCCGPEAYGYEIIGANPEPPLVPTFELAITVDPSGSGTTTGSGGWRQDTFVTITATPAEGYQFSGWSGDYVGESATAQIYMDADKSIVANFILIQLVLSLSENPIGSATLTGAGIYSYGDNAVIEAIPLGYFEFQHWSGDISSINNPETVLIDQNKSITANLFKPIYSVNISVDPSVSGSTIGAGNYEAGTVIALTAIPATGYNFVGWTGDVISTDNPVSLLVDSNKVIVAEFAIQTVNLQTYLILDDSGATCGIFGADLLVSPTGFQYDYGTVVTLTAQTYNCVVFDNWTGDVVSTDVVVELLMNGDKIVTGHFHAV